MGTQRIGLALTGGGIKGICHAGALKALEEYGIKPDIIAGVSSGGIVGALYADGYSPDEINGFFQNVTFRKMTKFKMKEGLFKIDEFERFLQSKLRSKTFEELKLPFRVVATNLDAGKSTAFSEGKLVEKLIASASMPALFVPKKIGGVNYVDGGVLKNLPASTIRKDCDVLIGINASPLVTQEYKKRITTVAFRSYRFMLRANMLHDKELCDVLIEPTDMEGFDTFDVDKINNIFEVGYNSAKSIIEKNDILAKIKEN